MIRKGNYKFIYYVEYEPELFDLEADPEETTNLVDHPDHAAARRDCEAALRDIVDPEKADRQAKDDQNALIDKFGGREAALTTGTPGATPVPGQGHE